MNDWLALALAVVVVASPLLLAALGELVVERAGMLNIGIEGMMLCGCLIAFQVTWVTGEPLLGALAASAVGAGVACAYGIVVLRLGIDGVVAGTALNILALGGTAVCYRAWVGVQGAAVIVTPLPAFALPVIALLLVPMIAWFLRGTRPGLVLRACGDDPQAARAIGLVVERVQLAALCFGGALAALAGAQLCLVQARTFAEGMTAGRGFLALAVVVCGRKSARGTLLAALLFGGATALQYRFQAAGTAIPYQVFLMLPYLVTLTLLAIVGSAGQPAAGARR